MYPTRRKEWIVAEYQIGDKVVVKSTAEYSRLFSEGVIDSEPVENGYFIKTHPEFNALFYYNNEIAGYAPEGGS